MILSAHVVKCRDLLGRLKSHGIQASRRTGLDPDHDGPDALLVADDGRTWLVVIWPGSTTQPSLGLDAADDALPALDEVARRIFEWRRRHGPAPDAPMPEALILAPALPAAEAPWEVWPEPGDPVRLLAGRHIRKSEPLARALRDLPTAPLNPGSIAFWRGLTVPEVRIQPRRTIPDRLREDGPPVTPLLLDYKQERCARLDLEPNPTLRTMANNLGLRVITGVAGCGKTLLLVHRARLLATHFPKARVLIVSHNRPLIHDVQRRVDESAAGGSIECRTFYQWLARVAPSPGPLLKSHETQRWIADRRQAPRFSTLRRFSDEWLAQEFEWMFSHHHAGDSYLTAERKGRGTALTAPQRREVLNMAVEYRAHLRAHQASDWSEWPLQTLEHHLAALQPPGIDHLLVDEAQFFAPVWLRLLLAGLKPGGHLFLCADPTQGFLRRRTSWHELGLDVRHRSHRLEQPYRSTRAILEFARSFYQRRQPDDDEPLNLPSPDRLHTIEPGTSPILRPAGSHQDQITSLREEIRALQAHGIPLDDVLVIAAGRDPFSHHIVDQLNAKIGPGTAALLKDGAPPAPCIGVVHLMAATGLERPIVFLLGLDDLATDESNPLLSPEERRSKALDHTRLIYVGLTRAIEKLVIYSSHPGLLAAFAANDA